MDIDDMVYTYSGVLFCNEKKGNPSICNEMDGPWEHCAKWDKSSRERQTLYNITYVWNLKKKKLVMATGWLVGYEDGIDDI